MSLRLQNFKFCCMDFTNPDLNCKDVLQIKGKTQNNSFFCATENTFSLWKFVQKRFDTFITKVRRVTVPFKYIF